jgi:transposase
MIVGYSAYWRNLSTKRRCWLMKQFNTVVGLDVHKETVVGGVLAAGAEEVKESFKIENTEKAIGKMADRFAGRKPVTFVYEAGPCGYTLQRQLTELGFECVVISPGHTPVRTGDRVKTDRRDAAKLARLYRAGELTVIRVPSREEEAARDLVRVREDIVEDRLRARHRMSKFLLRQGRVWRETKAWGTAHANWLRAQKYETTCQQDTHNAYMRTLDEVDAHLAKMTQGVIDLAERKPYRRLVQHLSGLKGIDTLSAITLAVEAVEFERFENARDFMGYAGLGICESSTGERIHRGGLTKTGNAHIRRILGEAAWSYRNAGTGKPLLERRLRCPEKVQRMAQKAQDRLHRKFWRMVKRGKPSQVAVMAVARELAGFVWAIAQETMKKV